MIIIKFFRSLEEVYECYGKENILKIVNIRQILFYAKCKCQPKWIDESEYDNKLVAYYFKPETDICWKRWKEYDTK